MTCEKKRVWAEIDLGHLEHNYRTLRALAAPGCRFMGMVKANAYGHGAVPVARRLEALGAEYLGVASLDEAEDLRRAGLTVPILVLGYTAPQDAGALADGGITQTVFDPDTARALSEAVASTGRWLKVHVKVDTGMSRLGILCREEALDTCAARISAICALPGLEAEGIFTHFSDADGSEAYTTLQLTRFQALLDRLAQEGISFPIRHCANSAAVLNYPCTHLHMIRPGVSLYGHYPDPACERPDGPGLLPVMSLKTRVACVKRVPAGTPVSYGRTATLTRDSTLATLSIGYADGLPRVCSNRMSVGVGGGCAPIVGRICMDMCMADVTDLPGVQPGDEVTVFGPALPVERLAALAGTVQYELLCAVSSRVPRIYRD